MRKLLFAALVAVCTTFPGKVSATDSVCLIEYSSHSSISTDNLVSKISNASGYSIDEVALLYVEGNIQVSEGDGFIVVTINRSGGIGEVIMIEDL